MACKRKASDGVESEAKAERNWKVVIKPEIGIIEQTCLVARVRCQWVGTMA